MTTVADDADPETDTDTDTDTEADRLTRVLAGQDPTGWFERLYTAAGRGETAVPWDRGYPTAPLVHWLESRPADRPGQRALVVGCGYGRDAEYLATQGFDTVAFDISETAIRTAIERHPRSTVEYLAADLFDPPPEWAQAFGLVVETTTVQSLPITQHHQASAAIADLVAPGGTLLAIASAREVTQDPIGPPWPLTRAEIESFATGGLRLVDLEDLAGAEPGDRRWRAEFRRP